MINNINQMKTIAIDKALWLKKYCRSRKLITLIFFLLFSIFTFNVLRAQDTGTTNRYGNTLNVGVGLGYYGYINHSIPVVHLDYEFDVATDFTLAPFIDFYSFRRDYYYGNPNKGYRYYQYSETAIPIGVKGTYYFDDVVKAGSKWDFYIAGSLGFVIINSRWDNGYEGDRNVYRRSNPFYLNAHLGTEYHVNSRIGIFLDLSTGVSTIGLTIH